jgi:preprotein translocase subunit SecE
MRLGIYKRGQGFYTRIGSAFGLAIVAGLGCRRLYQVLQATDLGLWVKIVVPAGSFAVLSLVIFWLVNTASLANFMIAAEGEMKKVSWSSRKEIAVSTFIVIMVVIIMAVLLGVTDMTFQLIFKWLLA